MAGQGGTRSRGRVLSCSREGDCMVGRGGSRLWACMFPCNGEGGCAAGQGGTRLRGHVLPCNGEEGCMVGRGGPLVGARVSLQWGEGLYGRTRGGPSVGAHALLALQLSAGAARTSPIPSRRSHLWGRFPRGPVPPWRADCLSAQGRGLKFVQEFVGNPLQLPDNFYIIKIYNVCKKNVNSKKSPANLAGRGTSLKLR